MMLEEGTRPSGTVGATGSEWEVEGLPTLPGCGRYRDRINWSNHKHTK